MPHALAQAVEVFTTAMTVAGMGYFLAVLVAASVYQRERHAALPAFAPAVSILKSLKGLDPGMLDAFRSHCRQAYLGDYELLFGVSSLDDPAAAAVTQLKAEFPDQSIRLIECPQRLGANGKVSTLAQLVPHAQHEFLLINDSDITVSTRYLERTMARFAPAVNPREMTAPPVGLVTALYRGRGHRTAASAFEALGIATEFQPGVLLSKLIEGGLHYGLGSTLAIRREALNRIGGLEPLLDHLADDYELGARIAASEYRIALSAEVVQTAVPEYTWRGYFSHQLRWLRTVRDARPWGYAGLVFTHGLGWALLNVLAGGISFVSLWLLGMCFFLRLGTAMAVGAAVLGDHHLLDNLWMLPIRDVVAMGLWVAGFAGNTIEWRGERFVLKNGKLQKQGTGNSGQ
ncbi:MAG TPA: bacteriohopanetetrol glucosamine biosynthesis glycosyltransferase HpnI [Terracidiphilus sp.]|nr:bacteriohopanetetrol glucosamine biosynthesis glycosyltransferase HpnI [Terracidiphilus sp.]